MRKLKLIALALAAAITALTGCAQTGSGASALLFTSAPSDITFATMPVKRGDITQELRGSLYYRSMNTVTLRFETGGTLEQKNIRYNVAVKKGDVLGTLAERSTYAAEISRKNQAISELEIQLADAESKKNGGGEVALAKLQHQQAEHTLSTLLAANASEDEIARQQFAVQEAKNNYDSALSEAENNYKSLSDDLAVAKAELRLLQSQYDACTVISPIDGICIASTRSEPGDAVSAGSILVSIADPAQLRVCFNGSANTEGYLALGDKVVMQIEGVSYNAKVIQIPATQPYGVYYAVNSDVALYFFDVEGFDFTNASPNAMVTSESVTITIKQHKDVMLLESYLVDGNEKDGYTVSMLAGNTPVTKPVTVGLYDGTYYEITGGLSEGDLIVYD